MAERELSTAAELAAALEAGRQAVLAFFGGLPEAVFFAGLGEGWSPAQHLDHLTRSNRPVAGVLGRLPEALSALGGDQPRPSRSFEALRDSYRARLAQGGRASGPYLPELRGQDQSQTVRDFDAASGELVQRLGTWPQDGLDRYQLPHPLLGPLTLRELLYFTLYHNAHHLDGVRARLAPATPGGVQQGQL